MAACAEGDAAKCEDVLVQLDWQPSSSADFRPSVLSAGSAWPEVELTATLPADLVRGVALKEALSGFGRHWSDISVTEGQHLLSVPVDSLDDFLSHDWKTGRYSKFFALCYVYNRDAAVCASMSAGLLLGLMSCPAIAGFPSETFDIDPLSIICPLVFFLVLTTWHRPSATFLKAPRVAFLDKLCIDQHNQERKSAGILGLAAFLKHSERLVILWSPRYFTRLWCAYEVATWLNLGKSTKTASLVFLPVSIVRFTLLLLGGLGFAVFSGTCLDLVLEGFAPLGRNWKVCRLFSHSLATLFVTATIRKDLRDFMLVPQQVANFSIRHSQCFCCTNNHRHPETGERLMCDRKLVYQSLLAWYSDGRQEHGADDDTVLDDCLDRFDEHVRRKFSAVISTYIVAGKIDIGYWNSVLLSLLPAWDNFDKLRRIGRAPPLMVLFHISLAIFRLFVSGPLVKFIFIRLLQCCPGGQNQCWDAIMTCFLTLFLIFAEQVIDVPEDGFGREDVHGIIQSIGIKK
eukprot:TRINITY_DN36996_c0_g1_i2.p1 TRINITY_DN36996_c0_g1~~TRINITY_DN36996_c0_g1_i2.p1  ORF type:complete len:546 (+),score=50.02 TRINITY_DN36996_c0_g1_i2:95-1639(+)